MAAAVNASPVTDGVRSQVWILPIIALIENTMRFVAPVARAIG
jgi:hypothetical protein